MPSGANVGRGWLSRVALVVAFVVLPVATSSAHEPVAGISGFPSLVLHPWTSVDTALVMLALGLVAGATEQPKWLVFQEALVVVAAAAAVSLQSQALAVPGLWRLPLVVAAVLGGIAAAAPRIGWLTSLVAALAASATVGLALAPEAPGLGARLETAGAATAAVTVALVSLGLPRALARHAVFRIAGRVAGAWIAAIAALGLTVSFR